MHGLAHRLGVLLVTAILSSTTLATEWREWSSKPQPGTVRWGVPWVERAIGQRPMPGATVVVAADSNVGKSFFTLELLRSFAASGPTVLFALEDPPLELGRRMDAAGYAHPNLHIAFPDPGDALRALDEVMAGPLKPVAVGFDYVQVLSGEREMLDAAIRGIRARSLAHRVVSVVASQVNALPPGVEDRGCPDISRVKGSKSIRDAADVMFMLGRGKERTLLVEIGKAKGAAVGARARYRRGDGGRLMYVPPSMDEADEEEVGS